jgi:hypothetical protein
MRDGSSAHHHPTRKGLSMDRTELTGHRLAGGHDLPAPTLRLPEPPPPAGPGAVSVPPV